MEIVLGGDMRDAIVVHDLRPTQLQIRGIDFAPKNFIESAGTGKDLNY